MKKDRTRAGNWRRAARVLAVMAGLWAATAHIPARAEVVPITILQMNDVYEITPVEGGKSGGLARVATVRKELMKKNPRTYTILSGDLFSPSALGTAKINGEALAGAQMVAVMNIVGLDYATFGNHEFDIAEDLFAKRIQESKFQWFSGNVKNADGKPFDGVQQYIVIEVKGARKSKVRVGFIGATIPSNPRPWVQYADPIASLKEQAEFLRDKVQILIAVTHLSLALDEKVAERIPQIDLILGGHEHENVQVFRGSHLTPIYKADANARTVYIHDLRYDTVKREL